MHRIFAANTIDLQTLSPAKDITNIGVLVNIILRNSFVIAGILTLILLIFGGFSFIMSAGSGDSKGLEKAKQTITVAVIGLTLIVLSASIVSIIGVITGQQLLGL